MTTSTVVAAVAAASPPPPPRANANANANANAAFPPPCPELFYEFEALWLAERSALSLGRTAASWVLRDVEEGRLPCDARLLARRARALAAGSGGGGHIGLGSLSFDGRALLQTHPGALALDADELRGKLSRVLQLLPRLARQDPTGLAMAALSPLVLTPLPPPPPTLRDEDSGGAAPPPAPAAGAAAAAAARRPSPERVALAHEELGAVVGASFWDGAMGPRLFAWLFDQQQQQQQQHHQQYLSPSSRSSARSLAAGLAALSGALRGPELASAALERAPGLSLACDDPAELERRVEWLHGRLGIGTDEYDGDDDDWASEGEQGEEGPRLLPRPALFLLLPARLAAALSTASLPDAAAARSIVSPARSTPRDPAGLPICPAEALSLGEFAGRPAPHALPGAPGPLAIGPPRALDAALASAARLLRRRAGWPPGAAVRFLRAYPGALAWDWSPGGACDRAFAQVAVAAGRRGGRWALALRTSPAAAAAALASGPRARRRLRYLGRAPGALLGVGLRRALAMPEVDFLEACPGYSMWRRLGTGDEEEEEEARRGRAEGRPAASGAAARQRRRGLVAGGAAASDLVLLGDLREGDRML